MRKICVKEVAMFFPVMVDLSAMEVLVVGGGRIACRKVKNFRVWWQG